MLKATHNRPVFFRAAILLVLFAVVFLIGHYVFAQADFGVGYATNVGLATGDIRLAAVKIVRTVLGFMGILVLVIILYGGFVWMTAAGRADRLERAKKILLNAVVGLIIILLALAIVQYIFIVIGGSIVGGTPTDVCVPGETRGSCEECLAAPPPANGYWYWHYEWPGCDGILPSTSFTLNDVQTAHGGSSNKDDVFWCSKVQNVFNHNVDPATVMAAYSDPPILLDPLRIAAETTPLFFEAADGTWQTRGNVVTFTPRNNEFINRDTQHWEHISAIEDTDGRFLTDCTLSAGCETSPPPEAIWKFYVGSQGDIVNPYITSTYPQSSDLGSPDINVPTQPIIEVNFSENIDVNTVLDVNGINPFPGHIYLYELDGPGGSQVTQVDNSILVVELNGDPTQPGGFKLRLAEPNQLKPFTYYEITIQDIADLCGNLMFPSPYTWQFATNDDVAGIASYYPSNASVCPDSRISVSFNTSMYYNRVRMQISGGGNIWNYVLDPSLTGLISDADADGEFRILDATNPLSTHYKVYEFVPAVALQENTIYDIYIETDKIIDINGTPLTHTWQFPVTDLASCVCTPHLSHLSKDQGPVGECLTVNGYCFTGTQNQSATISALDFDSTAATIGSGYSGTAVGTSVPMSFSPDESPQVSLTIDYVSGNSVPPSNQLEFLVTPGAATGPCLWSVQPNSGPRGLSGVRLLGDRFGDTNTTRQVLFTPAANAIFNVSSFDWTNSEIKNVIVPASAIDGEVTVQNDQGISNGIYFDVSYCGDEVIDSGEACDGANLNGQTCSNFGFVGGTLSCSPVCQLDQSACSNAPNVAENGLCQLACAGGINDGDICFNDDDCPSASCNIKLLPSPNPYKNSTNACLNATISADFNTDIDPATITSSNIFIQECLSDNCLSLNPSHLSANLTPAGSQSFRLTPSSNLTKNTTYQVTLKGGPAGLASSDSVSMVDDYTWHFKTKNEDALCPIERTFVEPINNTLGANQSDSSYNASAVAPYLSTNCALINSEDYNWTWDISLPNLAVSVQESLEDSNATVTTADQQGNVKVLAETENKQSFGNLTIAFESCSIDPTLCDSCPGSFCDLVQDRCTPVINTLSPDLGPSGRIVAVQGCFFKPFRGSGHVDFDSTPVTTYACGASWSDTQVLVDVPDGLPITKSAVSLTDAYGLTSNIVGFDVINQCLIGVSTPPDGIPRLCSLNPVAGMPQDNVSLSGENFGPGTLADTVTFDGFTASINSWNSNNISAQVPDTLAPGDIDVIASVNSCPSNPLIFNISTGGPGDPCDGDIPSPVCDPANNLCWSGFYCDETDCTCQSVANANIISSSRFPTSFVECPNVVAAATFDTLMNRGTINSNTLELWGKTKAVDPPESDCLNPAAPVSFNSLNSNHSNLFSKILAILRGFFTSSAQAQAVIEWWCPTSGYVRTHDVQDGVDSCANPEGCTAFTFSPLSPLDSNYTYELHVLGGNAGVKTILGGQLNTALPLINFIGPSYSWNFTVGSQICTIHHVEVDISLNSSIGVITRQDAAYDYFTCAGRNDCPDDIGAASGNQHDYFAQAYDKRDIPLATAYEWTKTDDDNLIQLSSPTTDQLNSITPNPFNGDSIVRLDALDPDPSDLIEYGQASTAVDITNFMCQNPWPSLASFPYQDSQNIGTNMTFSTFYCRDRGYDYDFCLGGDNNGLECVDNTDCPNGECRSSTDDDLPAISYPGNIRDTQPGFCVGGLDNGASCTDDNNCSSGGHCYNVLKDFIFLFDKGQCSTSGLACSSDSGCATDEICRENNDSIGIRIYNNGEHLSPGAWLQKYSDQPGGYSVKTVDGYEAISSGRTNYINMAVDTGSIWTNMFLLSYTNNYQPVTLNIHDQLLDNLTFNTNSIDNARICTNGLYCEKDSDCPAGETCDADKIKLARDTIRLGALGEMIYHLDLYRGHCSAHDNLACTGDSDCPDYTDLENPEFCLIKNSTYPLLEAGSYLAGQSTSVWDSWNSTLASLLGTSLLLDPLNEVYCDPNAGYNDECWNQDDKKFQCQAGSHLLHYEGGDSSYKVYLNMEYANSGWSPSPTAGPLSPGSSPLCSSGAGDLWMRFIRNGKAIVAPPAN